MSFVFTYLLSLILLIGASGIGSSVAHAQGPNTSCIPNAGNQCSDGLVCIPDTTYGFESPTQGRCGTPRPSVPYRSSDYVTNPNTTGQDIKLLNPLKGSGNLESFLLSILDFVIRIGGIVVVLMIIFVGFQFVTARGNETKITKARESLLYTLIGALILLGAKAIALGIQATIQAISVGQ